MKFDQDLCLNLWYELNPRVRCAFGNVLRPLPKIILWTLLISPTPCAQAQNKRSSVVEVSLETFCKQTVSVLHILESVFSLKSSTSRTWQSSGRWRSPPPPQPLPHPRYPPRRRGAPFYNEAGKAENCEKERKFASFFGWRRSLTHNSLVLATFCQTFKSGATFLGPKLCIMYIICLH